jgi:NADP-dependent 3-hydroxy acid dehydrogenase YdfG
MNICFEKTSYQIQRTVVVTGATSGIGRACVERLIAQGHRVIALGRRTERLEQIHQDTNSSHLLTRTCDVRYLKSVQETLASLPVDFQHIDSLINNAGLMLGLGEFITLDPLDAETMVITNCLGVIHASSVFMPSILTSGRGHVINISSIAARHAYVGGHVYAATKAFVEQFGESLRTEISHTGGRVTNISPGRTESEFSLVRAGCDISRLPSTSIPKLQPEQVAETVCWVLGQPDGVCINTLELVPNGPSHSYK